MTKLPLILAILLCLAMTAFAAGVDGSWNLVFETEAGAIENTQVYKTKGSKLIVVSDGKELEAGSVQGETFSYTIPDYYAEAAGYKADLLIKGKVNGDKVSGTWEWDAYDGTFSGNRSK